MQAQDENKIKILIVFTYYIFFYFTPMFNEQYYIYTKVIFVAIFLFVFKKSITQSFSQIRKDLLRYLFFFLLVSIGSTLIINWLFAITNDMSLTANKPAFMYQAILLAPILEEFLYRYCMINRNHLIITIIISSFLFSISHGIAKDNFILYSLPYFINGILLGMVYIKSKNIWYSILCHFVNNLFAIFLLTLM